MSRVPDARACRGRPGGDPAIGVHLFEDCAVAERDTLERPALGEPEGRALLQVGERLLPISIVRVGQPSNAFQASERHAVVDVAAHDAGPLAPNGEHGSRSKSHRRGERDSGEMAPFAEGTTTPGTPSISTT